jgi:hypothetical protein
MSALHFFSLRRFALCASFFLIARVVYNLAAQLSPADSATADLLGRIFRSVVSTSGLAEYSSIMVNMLIVGHGPRLDPDLYAVATAELSGMFFFIQCALIVFSVLALVVLGWYSVSGRYVTSAAYRSISFGGLTVTLITFIGLILSSGHVNPIFWMFGFMISYTLTLPVLVCAPFFFRKNKTA